MDPLSQSGVTDVVNALRALYQRMADTSSGADADVWRNKSPVPEVLYLVPLEILVSFKQGIAPCFSPNDSFMVMNLTLFSCL